MIDIRNLSFSYDSEAKGKPNAEILKDINIRIEDNEFFCVLRPSGCGKSTLLKILAGFEPYTSGQIFDGSTPIKGVSYERAMVFQEDAVFPWLNVYDNVEYGIKVRGVNQEERRITTKHFIDLVGLTGYETLYPKALSGGMKKRVDLARVLANDPRILLMDEPFGALDAMTKERLQEQVVEIWENSRKTIVFITHDIEEALFLGDRVAILQPISAGGQVKIYDIDFPRPRKLSLKEEPEFQKMRRHLIDELKEYERL
jgi:NitT/TauT family transport system ATP-binding protein